MAEDVQNTRRIYLRCLQAMIKAFEETGGVPASSQMSYIRQANNNYLVEFRCEVKPRQTVSTLFTDYSKKTI